MGWFIRRREQKQEREKLEKAQKERIREHVKITMDARAQAGVQVSPTNPRSPIPVPPHMRPGQQAVLQRSRPSLQLAQHNAAVEQFQADLESIYSHHSARNMRLRGEDLVRRFQKDWNADRLPIKPIREFTNLPDLETDGIADSRTQAAVHAYLSLMPPQGSMSSVEDIIAWMKDTHRIDAFMDAKTPPDEPRLSPKEIVDDLQDLLDVLDDDPET